MEQKEEGEPGWAELGRPGRGAAATAAGDTSGPCPAGAGQCARPLRGPGRQGQMSCPGGLCQREGSLRLPGILKQHTRKGQK